MNAPWRANLAAAALGLALLMVALPGSCVASAQAAPGQAGRSAAVAAREVISASESSVPRDREGPVAVPTPGSSAVKQLLAFRNSDVKFDLRELMEILSDKRHEGWVLAAYPDPKTHRPLIGAGFSLDLPAREHPQRDPLNPHLFLEPSSAELWQAAGLPAQKLESILDRYRQQAHTWTRKNRRTHLRALVPQVTTEDASHLLRVASIQSILNAHAYCRNFDQLSASQQMALSQLVYQMGVNLEEFTQFLGLINGRPSPINNLTTVAESTGPVKVTLPATTSSRDMDWVAVQQSLVQSQWARLYRTRAISVIAMLDPRYGQDPGTAEHRVGAYLRPAVVRRHRSALQVRPELASAGRHSRRGLRGPVHRKRRA